MSRSVSTHSRAVATVFLRPEIEEDGWADFIEELKDLFFRKYPSLSSCHRWDSREVRVILENFQVEVSVSEYCGLVAICLAPLNRFDKEAFNQAVAERMAKSFDKHLTKAFKGSALKSLGHASNGEQFFSKV